jgi:hypothetical protein
LFRSFIVNEPPPDVVSKAHPNSWSACVRLLIGDQLGMRYELINRKVHMVVCTAQQAQQLNAGQISVADL